MSWEVICSAHEIGPDEIKVCKLMDGTAVIAVRSKSGTIKVFQGLCPHQQRSLADADLFCDVLTCAAHMWEFDVQNGQGVNGTLSRLAEYPTRMDGDALLIDATAIEPITW